MDGLSIARRFAAALDHCDFEEAAEYISPLCRYDTGHGELVGPEAIIASYRESAEWGRRSLDQTIYESAVEQRAGYVSVLYTDRILHHGQAHVYRSRQNLWLDDAGQVMRIVHEELPGEREALDAFFARCGVHR